MQINSYHRMNEKTGGILHMAYQPKSYKKFVATAATATLVASAIVPVASANGASTAAFTDVSAKYQVAVDYLVDNNITVGLTETSFGIDSTIKRGDAAIMLAKALGIVEDNNAAPSGFTDVPARAALAINSLKAAGIINGKTTTSFGFEDNLTRGEVALIMANVKAYDLKGDTSSLKFTDVSSRYASAVAGFVEAGITSGKTATTFGTGDAIKRGDFAIFVYKAETLVPATPAVVSVSAANAKELQFVFNQAIKEESVIDANDDLVAGVILLNSADARTSVDNAYLSADGKTLTLVANTTWNGSYAAEVVKDKIEAENGKKVAEFKAFVSVSDTTRPTFAGVTYEPSGAAKFTFSEPLDETTTTIASKLVVSGGTAVSIGAGDINLATDKKSFTVVLPATMTKDASYTFAFTGLKDFAGNLVSPNPLLATVVKADRDTTKPTVTNVAALDTGKLQVTFSEKIQTTGATVTVGNTVSSTYTLDSTGTIATFTNVTGLTAGVQSVTIKGAKDLAGLTLDDVTRVIQVSADTTAPAYASHAVETVNADRFLVVTYNEEVTANQAKSVTGSYVDTNSITRTITPITGADITTGTDKKSVRIKLPTTAGTYTLNLPVGLAEDTSAATNDSAARTVSFTVGTAVDTTKPVVSTYAQADNKVTVTFDREVTAASALNVNNYSIDGVSSPFESAIFKGDAKTVELTLKNDVITTNGVRNYTVSNVVSTVGSVMDAKTGTYAFDENVRPTVTSAKVVNATTIEVTLSEALAAGTVENDFDVFQGTSTTALVEVREAISGTNKVVITLSAPLDSLSGLTIKPSSAVDLTDVNGNGVNFVGPLAVTN